MRCVCLRKRMVLKVKRVTTEFGAGDGEDVIILTNKDSFKMVGLEFRV